MFHMFLPRDYVGEVEAAVTARLSTWNLSHLGVWCDLVQPPATPVKVHTASEIMELEDEARTAKFREVRAKLSQDTAAMVEFNSQKEEATRRSHVVKVMHERSQLEIGKEPLDSISFNRTRKRIYIYLYIQYYLQYYVCCLALPDPGPNALDFFQPHHLPLWPLHHQSSQG